MLYVWGVVMGIAILGMFASLAAAGQTFAASPVVFVGVAVAIKLAVTVRLLGAISPAATLDIVLGGRTAPIRWGEVQRPSLSSWV